MALALFAFVLLASAPAADSPPEWLSDQQGVLELQLAHLHPGRLDGGTLRLDRTKRLVEWIGAPGDVGCKEKVEGRFDDVKAVTIEEGLPGFVVELKGGKTRRLQLIPIPHALWLLKQPKVQEAMATSMKYGSDLRVADAGGTGSMTPSGSAAGGGPTVKKVEIPKEIAADTKKAVDALKEALGR